ncbi:hypothetical protein ECZU29_32230 [Escherichia coli]|nr:hypothetical protein ECZU29_32230 [Escherichia coli]
MNKIRAAVVGAGIYGKHHMNAYLHNPDTVLVAICDTDTERCDDLAMTCGVMGYTRLDVLLQEEAIDVVSVATPDPYHTESILTALRHGKHVLAEKPLATSVRASASLSWRWRNSAACWSASISTNAGTRR